MLPHYKYVVKKPTKFNLHMQSVTRVNKKYQSKLEGGHVATSNTPFLSPTALTLPKGNSIASHNFYTAMSQNSPFITMGCTISTILTQILPLPEEQPRSNSCFLPPSQTASRSSQPFFHSSQDRQTDRQNREDDQ